MSVAVLERTPVGSPDSSRRISPPYGSGVSRVIPARCRAAVLTEKVCISTCDSTTGRSEITASICAAVGMSGVSQLNWMTSLP